MAPKAAALAGRIGDGFITTSPDEEMIAAFRDAGGGDKPVQAGYKVCWGDDDETGIDVIHVSQMGGGEAKTSAEGFFEFYRDKMLPRLRELARTHCSFDSARDQP